MRRLALLVAGGALWLVLAAIPALADGGPHQLAINNGTQGLAGDCAACHRAHTAQASSLLREEMPGLCLACHDGTGATADVVEGIQYVPSGTGSPTTGVLGALRGGGFVTAAIDTGTPNVSPARLSYTSSHGTSFVAHIGTLTNVAGDALAPVTTTSTHGGVAGSTAWGSGTVWGNGIQGSSTTGATGVTLECASCHNPHGNGQYRILQTTPGDDFNGAGGFAVTNSGGVQVQDVGDASTTKNYTILPGVQASDVISAGYAPTQGDYWRKVAINSSGATVPWTTTSGKPDPMETGWTGITTSYSTSTGTKYLVAYPVNDAGIAAYNTQLAADGITDPVTGLASITTLDNRGGLMTAWCVQCHTRYNGQRTIIDDPKNPGYQKTSPSSLTAMTPLDDTFMFKHGTTGVGCEQCHVSHGSNAVMTGPAATLEEPGQPAFSGTTPDSRLLKVNNFGTCQLCHDPTLTYQPGNYIGPTPTPNP